VLTVSVMRQVRNGLVVLGALAVVVAIATYAKAAPSDDAAVAAPAPAATSLVVRDESGLADHLAALPEELAMVLVGTALIGVAAAVRRAA
jgi:hypothetical protein